MYGAINTLEREQMEFNRDLRESGYALASIETRDISDEQRALIHSAFAEFCGKVRAAMGY